MKKILVFGLMAICAIHLVFAQAENDEKTIEQLKDDLENANTDSFKVNLLHTLSYTYMYIKPDSAVYYAKEGLELAEKLKWEKGEAKCLNDIGLTQQFMGNYPKAMESFLKSLKISEERNDKKQVSRSLDCIGNLYIAQGEYRKGLGYLFKEKEIQEQLKDSIGLVYSLFNISIAYQHLHEVSKDSLLLDSAIRYQGDAFRWADICREKEMIAASLITMATLEESRKNYGSALALYRTSLPITKEINDSVSFCQIYSGLAELYKNIKQPDSTIYYGKKSLAIAQNLSFIDGILNSCKVLAEVYKSTNKPDSTVKYLELTIATKDSLFDQTKTKQMQTLAFNEELRQQEIEAEKERKEHEHIENLQMLGIAVFIIFIFVIVLSLSRVRINPKAIETIGTVSILMIFEFISMFMHPIIEEWTHHSVFLVFLILVGIANILVPLHHKLEHWMKHRIGKRAGFKTTHVHTPDGHITPVEICDEDHNKDENNSPI